MWLFLLALLQVRVRTGSINTGKVVRGRNAREVGGKVALIQKTFSCGLSRFHFCRPDICRWGTWVLIVQVTEAMPDGGQAAAVSANASAASFPRLKASIESCLEHYEYENAQFLAERLHAHEGNLASLLLLAKAYFRNGNLLQAWALLRASPPDCRQHLDIAFLLAKVRLLLSMCCPLSHCPNCGDFVGFRFVFN